MTTPTTELPTHNPAGGLPPVAIPPSLGEATEQATITEALLNEEEDAATPRPKPQPRRRAASTPRKAATNGAAKRARVTRAARQVPTDDTPVDLLDQFDRWASVLKERFGGQTLNIVVVTGLVLLIVAANAVTQTPQPEPVARPIATTTTTVTTPPTATPVAAPASAVTAPEATPTTAPSTSATATAAPATPNSANATVDTTTTTTTTTEPSATAANAATPSAAVTLPTPTPTTTAAPATPETTTPAPATSSPTAAPVAPTPVTPEAAAPTTSPTPPTAPTTAAATVTGPAPVTLEGGNTITAELNPMKAAATVADDTTAAPTATPSVMPDTPSTPSKSIGVRTPRKTSASQRRAAGRALPERRGSVPQNSGGADDLDHPKNRKPSAVVTRTLTPKHPAIQPPKPAPKTTPTSKSP